MATYQLLVFSWNDIFPSRPQTGTDSDLIGENFTFTGGSGDIVDYIDNDSFSGLFNDSGFVDNRIQGTIDGTFVDQGLVNPEYSYTVQDSGGNPVGEMYAITLNNANLADIEAFTFDFQPVPGETYTLAGIDSTPSTPYSNLYVCYANGTRIDTNAGPKRVEDIAVGDRLLTRDRGAQPVIWAGGRQFHYQALVLKPKLRPILIEAGALGTGVPDTPLVVSPQHRIHLRSRVAERMFGRSEVMVPARKLLGLDGIRQFVPDFGVMYHHLLCERHDIIRAEGCWAETLFLGEMTCEVLSVTQMAQIRSSHPDLPNRMQLHPCAEIAEDNRARIKKLVMRENKRPARFRENQA